MEAQVKKPASAWKNSLPPYYMFKDAGADITLAARSFAAAVDADWQRAGELRITAVPTHLCGGKRLAGFSSYDDFLRLIGKG